MLLSNKELETLPDDSNDVFRVNLLQKYAAWPKSLETMCLADFAANYDGSRGGDSSTANDSEGYQTNENSTTTIIQLQNNLSKLHKRNKPDVIWFHKNCKTKAPTRTFS